jgi:uncharacterized protein (TIGR02996 family)
MHPDESAFRATIAASPDDDAPVLIFADWLDEHGRDVEAAQWRSRIRERPGFPDGATCALPPVLPQFRPHTIQWLERMYGPDLDPEWFELFPRG